MAEYKPPSDPNLTFKGGKDPVDFTKTESKTGLIPVWAFTILMDYETCPFRAYLKGYKKIKEDQKDNVALNRGNEIHDQAEHFVDGRLDKLPATLNKFDGDFHHLRTEYEEGNVELERKWGIDQQWNTCSWKDDQLWGRIKLDAFERCSETYARVIDYKTGKKFGNELKHGLQGMIYTVSAFARYPELKSIKSEFWYVDHGIKLEHIYTRAQADILRQRIHSRAQQLTTATHFPPKPSQQNCKWCPYKKSGDCEYAE